MIFAPIFFNANHIFLMRAFCNEYHILGSKDKVTVCRSKDRYLCSYHHIPRLSADTWATPWYNDVSHLNSPLLRQVYMLKPPFKTFLFILDWKWRISQFQWLSWYFTRGPLQGVSNDYILYLSKSLMYTKCILTPPFTHYTMHPPFTYAQTGSHCLKSYFLHL